MHDLISDSVKPDIDSTSETSYLWPDSSHSSFAFLPHAIYQNSSSVIGMQQPSRDIANRELKTLYSLSFRENRRVDTLRFIFKTVESSFSKKRLSVVDSILENVDPQKIHHEYAIAILRSTSRAKSSLRHWNVFLAKAYGAFAGHEKEAQHLFRGLLNNNVFTIYPITSISRTESLTFTEALPTELNTRNWNTGERMPATRRVSV